MVDYAVDYVNLSSQSGYGVALIIIRITGDGHQRHRAFWPLFVKKITIFASLFCMKKFGTGGGGEREK